MKHINTHLPLPRTGPNPVTAPPPIQQRMNIHEFSTQLIGKILQTGVLVSSVIILLGLLLLSIHPEGLSAQRLTAFPHTLPVLWTELLQLRPQAIITIGLLLLIATPVLRVAASILIFMLEKDRVYVIITCIVMAILLYSIFFVGNTAIVHTINTQHLSLSPLDMFLIFLCAIVAGILGSLVGLGGGVLIVPLLSLIFQLPIEFAIGASIISVIATSSGAAAAYVRDHLTNIRIGMFLEIATTIGAISGAFIAGLLAPELIAIVFGIILIISAAPLMLKLGEDFPQNIKNDRWANWLRLDGNYPDKRLDKEISYQVTHTPLGFGMMYIAGAISGLLGIGSGTFKVIALDSLMRLPMKVSTTTSNFMIGVTAAASAGIYFSRGEILPLVTAPVALGILLGAFIGARLLTRLSSKTLRIIFLIVMLISAVEMILHGLGLNV